MSDRDKLGTMRAVAPGETFVCKQCGEASGVGDDAWTCDHCGAGEYTEGCLDDHMNACLAAQRHERGLLAAGCIDCEAALESRADAAFCICGAGPFCDDCWEYRKAHRGDMAAALRGETGPHVARGCHGPSREEKAHEPS